jgi:site-specific DNA-methyltransferase (adenine-specific)
MTTAPSRSDLANDSYAVVIGQQRMVRPELRFKSATNEWPTPDTLWKPLDDEFGFTLDVCSTHENAKCKNHFTLAEDGLKQPWDGVAWMNPPYGAQLARWVKKCHDEAKRGVLVVGLIPVRSNTSYWHDYIMGNEIRFVRGYPKFGNAKQGLKAPLAVVVWRPNNALSKTHEV